MTLVDILGVLPAQAEAPSTLVNLLPIILMFVILYFLMIRPQMKRQKEHRNLVANLQKGDEVITGGGFLGTITKVSDNYVTIVVADLAEKPVEMLIQRQAISSVLPKGTIKTL